MKKTITTTTILCASLVLCLVGCSSEPAKPSDDRSSTSVEQISLESSIPAKEPPGSLFEVEEFLGMREEAALDYINSIGTSKRTERKEMSGGTLRTVYKITSEESIRQLPSEFISEHLEDFELTTLSNNGIINSVSLSINTESEWVGENREEAVQKMGELVGLTGLKYKFTDSLSFLQYESNEGITLTLRLIGYSSGEGSTTRGSFELYAPPTLLPEEYRFETDGDSSSSSSSDNHHSSSSPRNNLEEGVYTDGNAVYVTDGEGNTYAQDSDGNSYLFNSDGSSLATDNKGNAVYDSDGDGKGDKVSTDGGKTWTDAD